MEQEKPFAYHVIGATRDNTLAIAPTLVDAIRFAADKYADMVTIHAYFRGNNNPVAVPVENYSEQKLATREEALAFVRERAAKIKEAETAGNATIMRLAGALRCSPEDTEEKQIEDYIKSSPRVWLPLEKIVEL